MNTDATQQNCFASIDWNVFRDSFNGIEEYTTSVTTDDVISIALHTALSHLDKRNSYVRILFIDKSSAFNTILPKKIITKLRTLGLNTSLCNWMLPDGPPPGGKSR